MQDGGWILVTNSEVHAAAGERRRSASTRAATSSARTRSSPARARTAPAGRRRGAPGCRARRSSAGSVWGCDPTGSKAAVAYPALGVFQHEAACVDPVNEQIFLTEDRVDGGLYRFTPDDYPELDTGRLEMLCDAGGGQVVWRTVPDPQFLGPTQLRQQVRA